MRSYTRRLRLDSWLRSERFVNNIASELVKAYLEHPQGQEQADERKERLDDLLYYFYYSTLDIARGEYSQNEAQIVYNAVDEMFDKLLVHKLTAACGVLYALAKIIDFSSKVPGASETRRQWQDRFHNLALELGLYG